ncbi:hypothetical protein [Streptomyces sp. WAC08241]|uniref:hypothetical protein n=1 Tax=Streptomyces sp. WAC08241 TaxID=2487421 RepID=UPI000F7B3DB7|nr:hypothetical protein [Streptomyces sp. WAC08241]RSS32278.1 hypothetical protein EF906_34200 [Streptomyces sp. WAC08241]
MTDQTPTDAELHARCAHPDWEYTLTEGPRKQWDYSDEPPYGDDGEPDTTWERNVDMGRKGWERFDYTEESYWRRRKPEAARQDAPISKKRDTCCGEPSGGICIHDAGATGCECDRHAAPAVCGCGETNAPLTVHRVGAPCYMDEAAARQAINQQPACPGCGHTAHHPGTECEAGVEHGLKRWHRCLCLNLVGAETACHPKMTCQGGTLGYSDVWHIQRRSGLRGLLEHVGIDTTGRDIAVDGKAADAARPAPEEPEAEPREPDNPAAWALARHIADHPVSVLQAAFRYLNAPLTIELHGDGAARQAGGQQPDTWSLATPCGYCAHTLNWHVAGGRCRVTAGEDGCGCTAFVDPTGGHPEQSDAAPVARPASGVDTAPAAGPDDTQTGTEARPAETRWHVARKDGNNWIGWGFTHSNHHDALQTLAQRRERHPDTEFRLVRETTTWTVEEDENR